MAVVELLLCCSRVRYDRWQYFVSGRIAKKRLPTGGCVRYASAVATERH